MNTRTVRVRELCEQIRGVSFDKGEAVGRFEVGRVAILRAGNIGETGLETTSDLIFVPKARVSEKQMLRPNDVVIATSSGSLHVVGKAAQVVEPFDGSFGAFCKVLRPNSKVHPRYFAHFFRTREYRRRVSRLAAGANINNLKNEHLDDTLVPLPSMEKQRRIADVLDRADDLRATRRASGRVLKAAPEAALRELLAANWPKAPLAELGEVVGGATPKTSVDQNWDGDIRWITPKELAGLDGYYIADTERHITARGLASCAARVLPVGSVLFSSRAPIGYAAITARPMATNQGFKSIIPKHGRLDARFLTLWLRANEAALQGMGSGATFKELSKRRVESIQVPVPPLREQERIGDGVDAVHNQLALIERSTEEIDALFESLLTQAFAGTL